MKIIFSLFLFSFILFAGNSEIKIPEFEPVLTTKIDLSEKAQNEFKRRDELLKRGELTDAEQKELEGLTEKYPEVFESVWDVISNGDGWYNMGGPFKVKASSSLKAQKGTSYSADNAKDLSFKTAWVEGKKDDGIGEYLEYYFKNDSPRVTTVIISNGYVKSQKAWEENNRVKKLKVYVNNKVIGYLNLKDTTDSQSFEIGTFGKTKDKKDLILKFEIVEIYKGTKYQDTAITEIWFNGLDVL